MIRIAVCDDENVIVNQIEHIISEVCKRESIPVNIDVFYSGRAVSYTHLMCIRDRFNTMIATAGEELAPHKVCAYIYDLANAFNHFYHETKILGEENEERKQGLVALLVLTRDILETCIDMLGFEAPEKM